MPTRSAAPTTTARPGLTGARRRTRIAAAALAAAALSAPGATANAASWSSPTRLPTGPGAGSPAVAATPDTPGAAAVWLEHDRLYGSVIGRTGSWSKATAVSIAGKPANTPALAAGTHGRLLAVWRQYDGKHWRIAAAARLTTGAWSAVAFLSPSYVDSEYPAVVLGRGGGADVVWTQRSGDATAFATAAAKIGGTAPVWKQGGLLTTTAQQAFGLRLTIGKAGNDSVRAAWLTPSASGYTVRTASHAAGGRWGSATAVGTTTSWDTPSVTVDRGGRNTVVYNAADGFTYVRRSPGGSWSKPKVVPDTAFIDEGGVSAPSAAVAADGSVKLFWSISSQSDALVVESIPLSGEPYGEWDLDGGTHVLLDGFDLKTDDAGNTLITYARHGGEDQTFLESAGSLGGFGAEETSAATIDAAGDGNAVAVWQPLAADGLTASVRR